MADLADLLSLDPQTLSRPNQQLLAYWQALRTGEALPRRADFNPRQVGALLPMLVLFQVWPDAGVRCRLAGSMITRGLGFDLSGQDYLALTPAHFRKRRLERFSELPGGIIARTIRHLTFNTGQTMLTEELMLPFGDQQEDGSYHVLVHVGAAPIDSHTHVQSTESALGPPLAHLRYSP